MSERIKEFFHEILNSRLLILGIVVVLMASILIQRLFVLQIINGESYQENYTLKIEKERVIESTRGNIYDRNGELLAYNELSYTIAIEDNGTYSTTTEKNASLNAELYEIIQVLDENGDSISNSFGIDLNEDGTYSFNVSGTSLLRFLADVYGRSSTSDLQENSKLGYNEAEATADQVMEYLCSSSKYNLSTDDYAIEDLYRIVVLRYALSANSYQKYILTDIATEVSDETVAYISEHSSELQGVSVETDTIRKYVDSEYFSHIIGYTGLISAEEYEEYSATSDNYSLTDIVGKSGIEQYMDAELKGTAGYQKLYVDNLGKEVETIETVDPVAGNDVYLSIDKNLQEAAYDLLEQEIAGIVYSKITNTKTYDSTGSSSDIEIPIYDVYFALINNNVIDIDHFFEEDASTTEQTVGASFSSKESSVLASMESELTSSSPTIYSSLTEEMQTYMSYVLTMLSSNSIYLTSEVDTTDETYLSWKAGEISLKDYLSHAIEKGWIDITQFELDEKYSDSTEIYENLIAYVIEELGDDTSFAKEMYEYLIQDDVVTGTQLCLILFDQGVLDQDDESYAALSAGTLSSYDFLREKIKNIEITPAQLALDPCSGSVVITNPQTGELLALVSYPGYDNNRLANTMDSEYYASLQNDLSLPLYDYATLQETAPGSTFKMVTAAAGLTEGVITVDETIEDKGVYENVSNGPSCWIWNSYHTTHGFINVSEALRDSCNYFFYEVGYRLSNGYSSYDEDLGIELIQEYAEAFGLGEKTGIEIPESTPQIADEYPITASIGQSNNNFATIHLARYITAVANRGTVYGLTLLSKLTDTDGNVLETYTPEVVNTIDEISDSTWDAIQYGNYLVVQEQSSFTNFPVAVAGKTGTAQQVSTRPNHALFVCYAPYDETGTTTPEIAIATRIAYGYASSNAAEVTEKILEYYYGVSTEEELLSGEAEDISTSNSFTD